MTQKEKRGRKIRFATLAGTIFVLFLTIWFWRGSAKNILQWLDTAWNLVAQRDQLRLFMSDFGRSAPIVYISFQILQVIFAPVPGEASGFIGGYLFGTWKAFGYSTIGLTLGSWINFSIARFVGGRYVRKMIPAHHRERFDRLAQRRGIFVIFLLFVIPGFPKDYLCLFLGLTQLPLKLFLIISTIGRMPGTLALSIQGASLYNREYISLVLLSLVCLLILLLGLRYQEAIYRWMERTPKKVVSKAEKSP